MQAFLPILLTAAGMVHAAADAVPPEIKTFGHYIREAGYQTAFDGKRKPD